MNDSIRPWRYSIDAEGTVTRGRMYRIGDADQWTYYWDDTSAVAFYNEGFRGMRPVDGTDTEAGQRAITAFKNGDDAALKRLAERLTANPDATFITVALDRGCDLYALAWAGDTEREWRNEIESIYHGEVYRCETEEFHPHTGPDNAGLWLSADDVCEEWYGEDNAEAGLVQLFELDAFPAEQFILDSA